MTTLTQQAGRTITPAPAPAPAAEAPRKKAFVRRRGAFEVIGILLGVLLAAAIVYVLVGAIWRELVTNTAIGQGWVAFGNVLSDHALWKAAGDTAILVIVPGICAVVVGSIFAWLAERTDARLGLVTSMLPVVPLFLPHIALSVGWLFLGDSRSGLLNGGIRAVANLFGANLDSGPLDIVSWAGLAFLYGVSYVPVVFLTVSAALRGTDSSLDEASRISGASAFTTLWRVTLPSVFPAITSAMLLVLIQGIGEFSFARTIGNAAGITTISTYLVDLVNGYPLRYDKAIALGLLVLAVLIPAFILQARVLRSGRFTYRSGKASANTVVRLGPWKWPLRLVLLAYLALASILPLASIIIVALQPFWSPVITKLSFDNFTKFLAPGSATTTALLNSLLVALVTATVGMLIAAVIAASGRRLTGRTAGFLRLIPRVPATFSHVVLAVAILIAFSVAPFNLYGTDWIIILAFVLMYIPQASISANDANSQVPDTYFDAAAISGSSPGRSFLRIGLPLMVPGLLVGWTLLFVLSMGDVTASSILSGTNNPLVGLRILNILDSGTYSELAALASAIALISAVVVTVVMVRSARASSRK